jgi:glycosyltransferase involved in cell wall biosynthesis
MRQTWAAAEAALALASSGPFDVLHFLDGAVPVALSCLTRRASLLQGMPLFVTLHPADFSWKKNSRNPPRALYKMLTRAAIQRGARRSGVSYIVHAEWHRDEVRRDCRLPLSAVHVMPYGIDPPVGERLGRLEAREALGIDYDGPLFLYFGSLRHDRGADLLLQAFAHVQGESRLMIAGPPHYWTEKSLRALVPNSAVQERVYVENRYIPDKQWAPFFLAADAVVFPYRRSFSGTSGPLRIAFSFGKGSLVSDIGPTGELVRQEGVGLVFRPEDVSSLTHAMERFLSLEADEVARMEQNCLGLRERHSWRAVAARLMDIYSSERHCRPTDESDLP